MILGLSLIRWLRFYRLVPRQICDFALVLVLKWSEIKAHRLPDDGQSRLSRRRERSTADPVLSDLFTLGESWSSRAALASFTPGAV